jgi:hypothetical protein
MKANIKIEAINYGNDQNNKLWSTILDRCVFPGLGDVIRMPERYGVIELPNRKLFGKVDYSKSNSKATRGVYVNYTLETGKIYAVSSPTSWKSCDRFFATVSDCGDIDKWETYEEAAKYIGI